MIVKDPNCKLPNSPSLFASRHVRFLQNHSIKTLAHFSPLLSSLTLSLAQSYAIQRNPSFWSSRSYRSLELRLRRPSWFAIARSRNMDEAESPGSGGSPPNSDASTVASISSDELEHLPLVRRRIMLLAEKQRSNPPMWVSSWFRTYKEKVRSLFCVFHVSMNFVAYLCLNNLFGRRVYAG